MKLNGLGAFRINSAGHTRQLSLWSAPPALPSRRGSFVSRSSSLCWAMASNVGNSNGFDSGFVAATPSFESVVARMDEDINVVVNEMDVVHSAMQPIDNEPHVSSNFDSSADVNAANDLNADLSAATDAAASSLQILASRLSAKFAMLDVQLKYTQSAAPVYFLVVTRRESRAVGLGEVYLVVQERSVLGTQIEIVAKDREMKSKTSCLFTKFDVELRLIASDQVVQNESWNGINELCNGTVLMQALNDDLVHLCKGFSANSKDKGAGLVDRSNGCLRVVFKQEDQELVCANCSKWTAQMRSKDGKAVCNSDSDDDVVALDKDTEGDKKGVPSTITFPLSNEKKEELQARLDELKSSGLITVSPATEKPTLSMATSTVSRPRVASVAKSNSTVSALRSLHGQIETGVIHLEKLPSRSARLDAHSAQSLINDYRHRKQKAAKRREERQKELEPSKRVMRKCKICLFQHTNKITFSKHVEAHEQRFDLKVMVKCPACQVDISKVELNTHYQEHHDKEKAVCIECLMVMTPIELRRNHLDRVHYFTLKTKLCPACGQSFRTDLDLDIHYSVHHDPNAFGGICDHCGHSFKHKKLLEKHIARHHTNTVTGVIRCPFCDQVFEKAYSWHTHIKTHSTSKPYRCRFCDFSSIKRFAVVLHMKKHHFPEATVDDVIGDGSYTFVDKFGHELKKPNIKDYLIKKVDYERMVQQGLLPPSTPVDHPNMKEEHI